MNNENKIDFLVEAVKDIQRRLSKLESTRDDVQYHRHEGPFMITEKCLPLPNDPVDKNLKDTPRKDKYETLEKCLPRYNNVVDKNRIDLNNIVGKIVACKNLEELQKLKYEFAEKWYDTPSEGKRLPIRDLIDFTDDHTMYNKKLYDPQGVYQKMIDCKDGGIKEVTREG